MHGISCRPCSHGTATILNTQKVFLLYNVMSIGLYIDCSYWKIQPVWPAWRFIANMAPMNIKSSSQIYSIGLGSLGKQITLRLLLLATEMNLLKLRESPVWLVDGTFQFYSIIFKQLFSVHGIVGSGHCKRILPLLYGFLHTKTEEFLLISILV